MNTIWKWFPVIWLLTVRAFATDVTVTWDRHPSHTNLSRWEIVVNDNNALTTYNVPTNQITFVITNLPCGKNVSLNAFAVATSGLKSDPSNTLRVEVPCAPTLRLLLEASNNMESWRRLSNVATIKIDPNSNARFFRVAQNLSFK